MKNLPEKIYLQIGEEADIDDNIDFNELVGVSWCSDKIEESDVEFVRSDIAEQMAKEFAMYVVEQAVYASLSKGTIERKFTEFIKSRKALKAEK
jgi:heterodisulfide reductase subunit A-like polyferredoxin